MIDPEPLVTAVVVSYNTREDTLQCLTSLREEGGASLQVIVADNASADGTVDAIRQMFPSAVLLALDANRGFGAANNAALSRVESRYVLLINSDARLRPGALQSLVAHLDARPDVAIVGPKTLNEDGSVQLSWGPELGLRHEWHQRRRTRALDLEDPAEVTRLQIESEQAGSRDWVSGSCFLARTLVLRDLGGFDDAFFLYEEDVDLCRRARTKGWRVTFEPAAEVVHRRGRSMRQAPGPALVEYHRSHLRYYRKHRPRWELWALRTWVSVRAAREWTRARWSKDPTSGRVWATVLTLALRPPRV